MTLENNMIKFIYTEELSDDEKEQVKSVPGAFFDKDEPYTLVSTKEAYDSVYAIIRKNLDCDGLKNEIVRTIENIEEYIYIFYQESEFDILGVFGNYSDHAENVMEEIVYNFNKDCLVLKEWSKLIDEELKKSIMNHVSFKVKEQLEKAKEDGYDVSLLNFQ